MREYFLPLLGQFGYLKYLKHDESIPDSDVTPEYCAKHNWLIGSPETVARKMEKIYNDVGGFGGVLVFGFDYSDNPNAWHTSLRLLAEQVAPKIRHLTPA
jgi:alkanesulfonate monooxygenase SsuD/methylene tetrahydromethanopterin reductase-like flavin-dependent oxidoreductase (luciferase family)